MLSEAEIAKRCLLGMGECRVEGDGFLSKIEPARNGDYYIPQGVKRFAIDILLRIEDEVDFGKSKMIFASEEKISICGVDFKPKKGKKYEFLPLTIDLRGKDYKETFSITHGVARIGKSFCIHAKYIFDKETLPLQMAIIMQACEFLTGMGLICCTEDKQTAFIGKTNVTKFLKSKKFMAEWGNFFSWGGEFWTDTCMYLEKKGWVYSDGTAFDRQKLKLK